MGVRGDSHGRVGDRVDGDEISIEGRFSAPFDPQLMIRVVRFVAPVKHKRDVVIIGGGHNGLVAAAYLAKQGLDVLVLERRHIVGTHFPSRNPTRMSASSLKCLDHQE
jgi:NADPH-dependent 2,4-dienoyl-CoA reductase/sulfur reductase-like enzyme